MPKNPTLVAAMKRETANIQIAKPNDWASMIAAQKEMNRTGQYVRLGILDTIIFELTANSSPRMKELALQRTAGGRAAWPGIHLDWMNHGPEIALAGGTISDGPQLLLPSHSKRPFLLPPETPDPTWDYSEATPQPKLVPQRLEDRAMEIKGTPFWIIQPIACLVWIADNAIPGGQRREQHQVVADSQGLHMAFVYDTQEKSAHLINGRVI